MATSSTTGKCLIHNDLVASPATDKVGLDSQNSTDADCSQVETSYPYGPEELANRGKMVYEKRLFYPMHVGDVFLGRYLVLDKLGFGSRSKTSLHVGFSLPTEANIIYSLLNGVDGSRRTQTAIFCTEGNLYGVYWLLRIQGSRPSRRIRARTPWLGVYLTAGGHVLRAEPAWKEVWYSYLPSLQRDGRDIAQLREEFHEQFNSVANHEGLSQANSPCARPCSQCWRCTRRLVRITLFNE